MSDLKSDDQTIENSDLVEDIDEDYENSDDNLEDEIEDSEELEDSDDDELDNDDDDFDDSESKNECINDSEFLDSIINERNENEEIKIPNDERITHPILTKYERVRILGVRAKQIADGAKVMIKIKNKELMSSMEIAEIELKNKVTPFIIKRHINNNRYEHWKISELEQIEYQ